MARAPAAPFAAGLALFYLGLADHPVWKWSTLLEELARFADVNEDTSRQALEEPYGHLKQVLLLQSPRGMSRGFIWQPALHMRYRDELKQLRQSYEGNSVLLHAFWPTCVSRLLGDTCACLGELDASRAHYESALQACESLKHRPELALSHLGMAELLLEHYPDERDAAIEHLDFTIAEFREMKMQPSLERALRHRGLLKA